MLVRGVFVTPTPKIRTRSPSYDSHRVLILGLGLPKSFLSDMLGGSGGLSKYTNKPLKPYSNLRYFHD